MYIKFEFTNNTQPFEFNKNIDKATPIELLIENAGHPNTRRDALLGYVRQLDYLFRGVSNYADGRIAVVEVQNDTFGAIGKNRNYTYWNAIGDKTYTVVYDIRCGEIVENMYVADGVRVLKSNKKDSVTGLKGVQPLWVRDLLEPVKNKDYIFNLMAQAISVVTEFGRGYQLIYGDKLQILDKNDNVISIEEIKYDDVYTLVSLVFLILQKGVHQGVFLVDARGMTDSVLEGIKRIAKMYYSDTFLFVYNMRKNSSLERLPIVLPNYVIR